MATGRVLQFDHGRGYGFVAADDGGEDVFLHASAFDGGLDDLASGMRVEFKVMAGDRGRKAFAARLIEDESEPTPQPRPVPAPPTVTPPTVTSPTVTKALPVSPKPEEEPTCDVLSAGEFCQELTEILISTVPDLTGQQILQIRQNMLDFAKQHGWSDD